MSTIFLMILSRSLWLSGVIVFLFLLRTCFRRIPGWLHAGGAFPGRRAG